MWTRNTRVVFTRDQTSIDEVFNESRWLLFQFSQYVLSLPKKRLCRLFLSLTLSIFYLVTKIVFLLHFKKKVVLNSLKNFLFLYYRKTTRMIYKILLSFLFPQRFNKDLSQSLRYPSHKRLEGSCCSFTAFNIIYWLFNNYHSVNWIINWTLQSW